MHDLPPMCARVSDIVAAGAIDRFDDEGNTRAYPHTPKLSDLEVVCLAAAAEAIECDSENLLHAKIESYGDFLPHR